MVTRKIGPALAAVCTVVLKSPGETPFSANALAVLAQRADVPPGVINIVTCLTNTPQIDFDDADCDFVIREVVIDIFKSSGQTCVRTNRIFVHDRVFDEFVQYLKKAISNFQVGSGNEPSTTHGPLISTPVEKVARLVNEAEEIFGPVAVIHRFDSEKQVLAAANDCEIGIAAYLFTQDINRIAQLSEQIQSGMVAINCGSVSVAPAPFGGITKSGLGREGRKYGLDDYLQLKPVITGNMSYRSHL
ncbi:Aldehyde/histidinol dehydrogenase [Penicillium occitanis (nom. inval.)]|nr:Aldehyde/histidinol dehydrogenase [Penicillium occitanis (nom. inval.)]PCH09715.1 hypothetical protein PENOC_008330 [Penicillium occitanis (nom. inval.)]